MPRTPAEVLAHARWTTDPHIIISPEEVQAMIEAHIERRRKNGQKVPSRSAVTEKLVSGSAYILGKLVRVE